MSSALPELRSATRTSPLAPAFAMFAMAGLVVASALLGLREAAADFNPNASRIALADPWPFGLVTLIGWMLLERVAPALRGLLPRPLTVFGLLLVVRLTLVACLVLLVAGPATQLLFEAVT